MKNGFETLRLDTTGITALELLKLARETQLKVVSVASKNYFKYEGTKLELQTTETLKREQTKLDYIEFKIKQLESEE